MVALSKTISLSSHCQIEKMASQTKSGLTVRRMVGQGTHVECDLSNIPDASLFVETPLDTTALSPHFVMVQ
jgi:hypothetical protein